METLCPGVLHKLLQDMESSSSSDSDIFPADYLSDEDSGDEPAILQVTGIVPALTDSDLYPDQGFYLQVSDSSHQTYVSLPPGHEDLILSDNLQIGQLILVRRLEASFPVPILRDLKLIPGRHPLPYHTQAITFPAKCSKICRETTPERKEQRQWSASTWKMDARKIVNGTPYSNASTGMKAQRKELEKVSSALRAPMRKGFSLVDEESDESDKSSVITSVSSAPARSFVSMIPMPKTVRKIWEPNGGLKDRKREDKPTLKTGSSTGDLARFTCISKGGSSVEPWAAKRDEDAELKALHSNSAKRRSSTPSNLSTKNTSETTPLVTYDDMKWPECNVLWGSLPYNVVKYGKDVLRRRDIALSVALDAMQEACALNRFLGFLCTFSELQASKVDHNPQKVVEKFLNFHEELSRAILATQSLSRTNSSFSQSISTSSLHPAKDASERRKCAASWIKAALKSELSRTPESSNIITDPTKPSSPDRKSQTSKSRQKKGPDSLSALSALPTLNCNMMAADLANALQSECNRWFLRFIEKFLDVIHSKKGCCKTNECQILSLLCQLKRVDKWMVTVRTKDKSWATVGSKDSFVLDGDDGEAFGRVRRKIYDIFLKHVDSTAMAFGSLSTTDEDMAAAP